MELAILPEARDTRMRARSADDLLSQTLAAMSGASPPLTPKRGDRPMSAEVRDVNRCYVNVRNMFIYIYIYVYIYIYIYIHIYI